MKAIPMRILVVDDCRDNARMMKVLLKSEGHEVRTAFDGPEAVATAKDFRPDVVLLDLTLPGMSGAEVARTLREAEGLALTAVVAVSGYDAEDRPPLFDAHFVKPVDYEALSGFLSKAASAEGRADALPPAVAVAV